MKVSVSVLKEYKNLINTIRKVNKSDADFLHIDVMDGVFVKDKKFPIGVAKDAIKVSEKQTDMHLMVKNNDLIKKYALLKPDFLTFHIEVLEDDTLIDYIKSLGIKVGLAINPETDASLLIPYLDKIDLILFMSVTPGLPGQKFKESVIDKVKRIKSKVNKNIIISIDGGVSEKTVSLCKYAGCDMVVSGSFITDSNNYDEKIEELKQ